MTRHVNINENDVNAILGFNEWKRFGVSLKEGTEVHTCPLCESNLPQALSQDTLKEHVATVISMVEETLAEAAEQIEEDDQEVEADELSDDEVSDDESEEESDAEDFEDSDEDED